MKLWYRFLKTFFSKKHILGSLILQQSWLQPPRSTLERSLPIQPWLLFHLFTHRLVNQVAPQKISKWALQSSLLCLRCYEAHAKLYQTKLRRHLPFPLWQCYFGVEEEDHRQFTIFAGWNRQAEKNNEYKKFRKTVFKLIYEYKLYIFYKHISLLLVLRSIHW